MLLKGKSQQKYSISSWKPHRKMSLTDWYYFCGILYSLYNAPKLIKIDKLHIDELKKKELMVHIFIQAKNRILGNWMMSAEASSPPQKGFIWFRFHHNIFMLDNFPFKGVDPSRISQLNGKAQFHQMKLK